MCLPVLFLSKNNRAFVECSPAPISPPYRRGRDTSTYTLRTNFLYSYERQPALASKVRKNQVRLDLMSLNDRVSYHYNPDTASRQNPFQDFTKPVAIVEIGGDVVGPPRTPIRSSFF